MARRIGSARVGQAERRRDRSGSTAPDFAAPSPGKSPNLLFSMVLTESSSNPVGVIHLPCLKLRELALSCTESQAAKTCGESCERVREGAVACCTGIRSALVVFLNHLHVVSQRRLWAVAKPICDA